MLLPAPMFWVVAKLGGGRSGRIPNDTLVSPISKYLSADIKMGGEKEILNNEIK